MPGHRLHRDVITAHALLAVLEEPENALVVLRSKSNRATGFLEQLPASTNHLITECLDLKEVRQLANTMRLGSTTWNPRAPTVTYFERGSVYGVPCL